ncbi:MAG: EscU/YscU/HrcU family type III secretion system export apparatus switch protein [Pseudomonadota bacterium]
MNDQTTPPPKAVALRYEGKGAPRVVAKGGGEVAKHILAVAAEHGIPLHADPQLLSLLSRLELGDEIPENLYIAIARIIAFAYFVSGKAPPPRDT